MCIRDRDWKELISHRDKPLVNKAISGLYPPGSTIKGLVAISALENDVVNTKMVQQCSGSIELYGEKFHCWKKKGHGFVDMRKAIKESCDVYFYEVARRLGIDRLSETARAFGLGDTMVKGFNEEKIGVVPNTKWKKQRIGKSWYLGETLHSGIGQGYWQTTPMQLCLMTARIANGGYDVEPRIVLGEKSKFSLFAEKKKNPKSLEEFFNTEQSKEFDDTTIDFGYKPLFRNQENINFVKDAFFAATNEPGGTSYGSRLSKKEFMFAGKTGTSQVRRITEKQRELEIKNEDLPYEQRDHSLYVAFAPYNEPLYSISVVVEHGGSGSKTAAPIAKKVIKKLLERHPLRQQVHDNYKGAIPYIRVFDGVIKAGEKAKFFAHDHDYDITEVGHFILKQMPSDELRAGDVGYFLGSIRDVSHVLPGDTVTNKNDKNLEALPGFKDIKPMVFSGLYPSDSDDYDQLRMALEKLKLNDASLLFDPETSEALGFGFRTLHYAYECLGIRIVQWGFCTLGFELCM